MTVTAGQPQLYCWGSHQDDWLTLMGVGHSSVSQSVSERMSDILIEIFVVLHIGAV